MNKLPAYIAAAALTLPSGAAAADRSKAIERLNKAGQVLTQARASIPESTLARAQCIAVLPDVKQGAFLVGATYGAGYASCRTPQGWSPPAGISMRGGGIGLQAGATEADYVIDRDARQRLLEGEIDFDARASAAAGQSGPATDETSPSVLVWARSGGAFAGIDVSGTRLVADREANEGLYGNKLPNPIVLSGGVQPPPAAQRFMCLLP